MTSRRVDRAASTLRRALVPPARPNLVVVAWRWRYELVGLAAVILLATGLSNAGATAAVIACGVSTGVAMLAQSANGRRWLIGRWWWLVTPHRVRMAFTQAGTYSATGRMPAILCCSRRAHGEWVLLWLPAGVTLADLQQARDVIAGACYASDVRVVPHPEYRHIAALEVLRR